MFYVHFTSILLVHSFFPIWHVIECLILVKSKHFETYFFGASSFNSSWKSSWKYLQESFQVFWGNVASGEWKRYCVCRLDVSKKVWDNSLTGASLAMARGDGLSSLGEVRGWRRRRGVQLSQLHIWALIRNLKLLFHQLKLLVIFLRLNFPHGIEILLAYLPQLL